MDSLKFFRLTSGGFWSRLFLFVTKLNDLVPFCFLSFVFLKKESALGRIPRECFCIFERQNRTESVLLHY